MKKPNDVDRLNHILDSIIKIETYLLDHSRDDFIKDNMTIDAVVRNIEIIGEAATQLTRDLKAKYPQVEWRIASATRNRLIHGYFDVDAEIIWDTAKTDLPIFKKEIENILAELGK